MSIADKLSFVICLFVVNCISGASAFSCTQISKNSFRYYTENDRCGIRASTAFDNQQLYLYKDHRQYEGLPPVYSSVTSSDSWKPAPSINDVDLAAEAGSASSRVRRIIGGVSNVFSVITEALVREPVSQGPPTILEEIDEDTIIFGDHEAAELQSLSQVQIISLVDIDWLKAHEDIVSEDRVQNLHDAIVGWNAYRLPLLVDSRTGAILDGHHRYAVGRIMNLSRLPVVLVDYMNDESISVDVWPECGFDCLTKKDVVDMSLSDTVFPPKTSKHDFVSSFEPISVPLSNLR